MRKRSLVGERIDFDWRRKGLPPMTERFGVLSQAERRYLHVYHTKIGRVGIYKIALTGLFARLFALRQIDLAAQGLDGSVRMLVVEHLLLLAA